MYLSFILDIFKKGDNIKVTCGTDTYIGSIVKVTEELLAIRLESNSSIKIIKDEEITDVSEFSENGTAKLQKKVNAVLKEFNIELDTLVEFGIKNGYNIPSNPEAYIAGDVYDAVCKSFDIVDKPNKKTDIKVEQISNKHQSESDVKIENPVEIEYTDITLDADVEYDADAFDQNQLIALFEDAKLRLSPEDKKKIIEANSYVVSTTKHSFTISTLERPKESVLSRAIVECSLKSDLSNFSVGDTLPIIAYKHDTIIPDKVTLVLTPNSLNGIMMLLEYSIREKHYTSTKMLCYFLLSHIKSVPSRSSLIAILRLLKTINPFFAANQKIATDGGHSSKLSKNNKFIEKTINELINKGETERAIEEIDKFLLYSNIDPKYKSSLLLKKAQTYSSKTDYEKAKAAYVELIEFNAVQNSSPQNLSHLCTELARLQLLTKEDASTITNTIQRALKYNPKNTYASTLLTQVQDGVSMPIATGEDKELLVDVDESSSTVSKMIDIDIKEHVYTNEEIINRGGKPTPLIAKTILEEAKLTRDVDLSERYPIYLEAAKAFSELPIGSYDTQDYLEAVAYYAILKGNSLFMKFKQLVHEDSNKHDESLQKMLTRIKDSACSYYIESLNLLSSIKAEHLLTILSNYLKLNISLHNYIQNKEPMFSGQFNKVFFNCVSGQDEDYKKIAWSTIINVGSVSASAWNKLTSIKGGTGGLYRTMVSQGKRQSFYNTINICTGSAIDMSLLPGEFLKQSFIKRRQKTNELGGLLNDILKSEFDVHLLGAIQKQWETIARYLDLFLPTDMESKYAVDSILLILKPYANRNQAERTNLIIQAQRKLENQIAFINENTTFYGRTFFFPLFSKWKKSIQDILEAKISQMLPVLEVIPDPYYILEDENGKFVNLLIKNMGSSTAEGYEIVATTKDPNSTTVNRGKCSGQTEIAAGAHEAKKMNLPPQLQDKDSLEFEIEIKGIYQSKHTDSLKYTFTVEKEPTSSLSEEDILWKDAPIPEEQMFKGRQQDLDILSKHYLSIERDKPYILYGLTRTGKSSILKYLGDRLDKQTVRISGQEYTIATFKWDLSKADGFGNAKDMWQFLLYENIYEELPNYLSKDTYTLLNIPEYPRQKHLSEILLFLKKQHIYPIFYVDEFSFIKSLMDSGTINAAFLHTLRQFSLEGQASFIYAGTYDIKMLIKDPKYGITGQLVNAVERQVNEIDRQSAEDLMKVMKDRLIFTEEAINHIHKLSGDIPYFIQKICKYCGIYAVEKNRRHIGYPELETVIRILTCEEKKVDKDSLVKNLSDNDFQNNQYSPGDPKSVHAVISSIAYINDGTINPRGVSMVELQQLWSEKHIDAFRPLLADAINLLLEKRILTVEDDEDIPVYKISVDLFRRWWSANHQDINLELSAIK